MFGPKEYTQENDDANEVKYDFGAINFERNYVVEVTTESEGTILSKRKRLGIKLIITLR